MAGSTFGNIFKITTWGESHGKALGVVVDVFIITTINFNAVCIE